MYLTGHNLGARQKDLNEKVNKAVADKDNFGKYLSQPDKSDVDKIFKIDLAAKNKHVGYILEVLKSGDIVHIGRVLNKCEWLGDDDVAEITNVTNLHDNVFPLMSIKMKKKLLCTLAAYVKNEDRAIGFYQYCVKSKLYNIAIKFAMNTPEQFKRELIVQKGKPFELLADKEESIVNYIGDSFVLAQTYLDSLEWAAKKNHVLFNLRHMYSVSDQKYLDLLEKYYEHIESRYNKSSCFGSRLSKEIIKKHKQRVLKKPNLYVNVLKRDKVTKNSTINDVEVYSVALLPKTTTAFWRSNFYETYKFILDIIPANERFCFMKRIFHDKYPDTLFETSKEFYEYNFYNIMTIAEKEDWALKHIASGEEMLGSGNDYKWYKFVSFEKALQEIKRYIKITQDGDRRMEILNTLIDSAVTQNDLKTLLNYYYTRHVNEPKPLKERFLDKLIQQHKIVYFNEECWAELEKIFHSLDVFTISKHNSVNRDYMLIALVYYIVQQKAVPAVYKEYIEKGSLLAYDLKQWSRELGREKEEMVYQYFLTYYLTKLEALAKEPGDDIDVKHLIENFVKAVLNLLQRFSKTKEDIPELVNKYVKLDWHNYKDNIFFINDGTDEIVISEKEIVRYMKKDVTLTVEEFPKIKQYIDERYGRINWLLQKLKIYFHQDFAQVYLKLLKDCLTEDVNYRLADVAVYGILKLADDSSIIDFLEKHAPTSPKIDHGNISRRLFHIQTALCGFACVSRPPLPLSCVLRYVTGDYVQHCLPMFNSFLVNLPTPQCITFVESLINKPVSIQKHGLRLAFECFSAENLNSLINTVWKRTINVSLRKILYKSLLYKVLKEDGQTQLELFEVLKTITLDLNQDDDDELFVLLSRKRMPDKLMGNLLLSGWIAVSKLPEKSVNFERMTRIIKGIEDNLKLVPDEELIIITNEHVAKMLDDKEILNTNLKEGLDQLLKAKWQLTLQYLANVYNERQLKQNLATVKHIIGRCIEMWSVVREEKYVIREFCISFIRCLEEKSYNSHTAMSYPYMKVMLNTVLKDLQESLPERDIFSLVLQMRLSDMTWDIIIAGEQEFVNEPDEATAAIRTAVLRFSEAFENLIREYKSCGKYFFSFFKQIEMFVINELNRLNEKLDDKMESKDLYVIMCIGLLKFEMPEIYLHIVGLLPENYSGDYDTDYQRILCTVKAFQNNEVQYFMTEKFINNDFMFRNHLLEL